MIADDLTGASDTGVQFRKWGLSVEVLIGVDALRNASRRAEIIVVDTESRTDPPETAYAKVREAADMLVSLGVEQIYKKVDSTLRGNIGAELDAVMDATDVDLAFMAPAYPENGRTTVKGYQFINGTPINETEYALEMGVEEAHIPTLIELQCVRKVGQIGLETVREGVAAVEAMVEELKSEGVEVIVLDAVTEKDLAAIAKGAKQVKVLCGSAGLASELPLGSDLRSFKPVLAICGSTRSLARVQANALSCRLGCNIVKVDTLRLIEGETSHVNEVERCIDAASSALKSGTDVLITSAPEDESSATTISFGINQGMDEADIKSRIEEALAFIALAVLRNTEVSGIILTGGATALQVCKALKVERAEILNEVQPGIPLLALTGGLRAITKAGGFGSESSLVDAVKYLRRISQR